MTEKEDRSVLLVIQDGVIFV